MNLDDAQDEMMGLFKAAWDANAAAANGGLLPEVEWPGDTESGREKMTSAAFARFSLRHLTGRQVTFGPPGARRFQRPGIITVQAFAPVERGSGLSVAENLAIIARDAFEGVGTGSGLIFRNARVAYVGISKAWHQYNMSVEFEFDEMK